VAFTVESDHGAIEILIVTVTNIGGARNNADEMPNDGIIRQILEVHIDISVADVLMTNPEITGPQLTHVRGGAYVQYLASGLWLEILPRRLMFFKDVRSQNVIVLPTDEIQQEWQETDTDGTPLADVSLRLKCLKLRAS